MNEITITVERFEEMLKDGFKIEQIEKIIRTSKYQSSQAEEIANLLEIPENERGDNK